MGELLLVLALGVLIGAILGGLGGGGAILTVPALVYVVGQSAQEATTSSLVIVGLTAVVGTLSYLRSGRVRWRVGLVFGLVGIPATWAGSQLNHRVDQDALLLGFAALMVVAAGAMISGARGRRPGAGDGAGVPEAAPAAPASPASSGSGGASAATSLRVAAPPRVVATTAGAADRLPLVPTLLVASAAGLLTGFFGVGGGFVIVPALVLALRLPMRLAVGTSLVIVALNSATALTSRAAEAHVDASVVVPFAAAAMVATLGGKRVADRLPARLLQLAFAVVMILVAGYTAWQSIAGG